MRKHVLFISILLYAISNIYCYADEIVFQGTPFTRGRGSVEKSYNEPLSTEKQKEYELVIVKEDDNYIWRSRDNKVLRHHKSGVFDYFIQPEGSGYIKIMQNEEGYAYIEHVHLGLDTITYWGVSDEFNL